MRFSLILLLLIAAILGVGFWRYNQPLPKLKAEVVTLSQSASRTTNLPWPPYGQAAIGAAGYGILAVNNADKPVPIASIAKAVTALAVLKQKPLQPGQDGPEITLTATDEQSYRDYLAKEGSVFPVSAGQKITQKQALTAMLVPSANNIADTLVLWAFGSMENYVKYANQMAKELGMSQTNIADASGFSPNTTSTAKDLVNLAEAVLKNPLVAETVKQSSVNFPGINEPARNVNWLLGTDGIVGIKTGNSDQAKGCFLFAAERQAYGQPVTIVGAVLGAETRNLAMSDSRPLIQNAADGFESVTIAKANQVVGRYKLPWGGSVEAVAASNLTYLNWMGNQASARAELADLDPQTAPRTKVGSIKTAIGEPKSVNVKLSQPISQPSFLWRLLR